MTTPATGPISLLDLQNEFGGTNPISLDEYYRGGVNIPLIDTNNTTGINNIPTSGSIGMAVFRGTYKNTVGNYLATGSTNYTLPANSSGKINIICIGGGGGGGGGSNRSSSAGFYTGGAGGGSGGNAYAFDVVAAPGSILNISVGGGGSGGPLRDGIYGSNGVGTAGGTTSVTLNGVVLCRATGGQPGAPAQTRSTAQGDNPGGAAGVSQIPNTLSVRATTPGGNAVRNTQVGGVGAKGFLLQQGTALNQPDKGLYVMNGYGAMGITYSTNTYGVSGTGYGAGGSGGGTVQGDISGQPLNRRNSTNGLAGAVIVWWNY